MVKKKTRDGTAMASLMIKMYAFFSDFFIFKP